MTNHLRIIIAQLNFTVGAIHVNVQKILSAIQKARTEFNADIILFPELALSGYPSEDLLLRPDFQQQIALALQTLCQTVKGIDVVIGYPHATPQGLYNAASVIRNQQIIATYHKQCLPNYGVFDEARYFKAGTETCVFNVKGLSVGIAICEDLWYPNPVAQIKQAGAQLILSPNASPFDRNKMQEREKILRDRIFEQKIPIIYANHVCGQDDLVFDGGSLAIDAENKICAQAHFFQEQLLPVDIKIASSLQIIFQSLPYNLNVEAKIYQALVLSVRDYIYKNSFPGVLIGISGGIDSALVLAIAVDALGKDRVRAVLLPSRYTSELSMQLANQLVKNLDVQSDIFSIEESYHAFLNTLASQYLDLTQDKTGENIQARCRAIILMALSNKTGHLVLTTSNKSEIAVGYGTTYGDMAGGFAVLKDVYKTLVYRLAHYRNSLKKVIPQAVIDRAPTAELAPNQTDQDSLPPYNELDQILERYIEKNCSIKEMIAAGFAENTVSRIIKMVNNSEYKRRQAPLGPRITTCAFGRERRYPITSGYESN